MYLTKIQLMLRTLLRTLAASKKSITDRERESLFIAAARTLSPRINAAFQAQERIEDGIRSRETPAQFARRSTEQEHAIRRSINQ